MEKFYGKKKSFAQSCKPVKQKIKEKKINKKIKVKRKKKSWKIFFVEISFFRVGKVEVDKNKNKT